MSAPPDVTRIAIGPSWAQHHKTATPAPAGSGVGRVRWNTISSVERDKSFVDDFEWNGGWQEIFRQSVSYREGGGK